MSKQPEFLLLKQPLGWVPEARWDQVLGSVVLNPHSPLDNRTPDHPPIELNDISETTFTDFIIKKDFGTDASTTFNVEGLGTLHRQISDASYRKLHGKFVISKRLTQRRLFWEAMVDADPNFAEKAADWVGERRGFLRLRSRHEVCWIVGVLICKDVAIATSIEKKREYRARGDVLLGTAAQIIAAAHGVLLPTGNIGNASVGGGNSQEEHEYFVANGKGGFIFALEVVLIGSTKGKLQVTDKVPRGQKLGRGAFDDEAVVFPEDLQLQEELIETDWDDLLGDPTM
ncbi:hypothetical protein N7520_004404 [Penicillium odoratum]|uniref:uncharacterized protein n=1 Tax=Penicillium odoratum TaxID=1167516 RepID=UPI0025475FA6|nr:uncharacterized protein N7520_004404 [Penicillium odoratum]KAJ5764845.1 hypothetical protein N7520_004404 [Penicillium odoratum]